ncbi:hypothetical protein PG989_011977 [Apiospora arundinis]
MRSLAGPLVAALTAATTAAAQAAAAATASPTPAPSTTAAPTFSVLTITVQALTTTFTPPPKCRESHLSMMSPPKYEIWLNEPQPVPGPPIGECYPSEFIQGYKSMANSSSSIAPFFKPLVCPEGWHTAQEWPNGYIACCNSGYNLHLPESTADPDRPAYGGTCYSNFLVGQTVNVTKYGTASLTGTGLFPATSVADQAYAHPMDGYKVGAVPGTTSSTPSSSDDAKSGISGGAIAGIVIGAIALVAAIVLSVFFLFRRRQQQMQQDASQHDPSAQMAYAPSEPPHSSKGFGSPTVTANSHDPTVSANSDAGYQHQQWQQQQQQQHQQQMSPHELHSPAPAAELANTYRQGELDGDWRGHELRG